MLSMLYHAVLCHAWLPHAEPCCAVLLLQCASMHRDIDTCIAMPNLAVIHPDKHYHVLSCAVLEAGR